MANISNFLKDPFAKTTTQNSSSSLASSFGGNQSKSTPINMSVNKATPSAVIPPTIAAPASKAQSNIIKGPVTISQLSNTQTLPPVQPSTPTSTMSFGTAPSVTQTPTTTQTGGREDILKRILDVNEAIGGQANRQAELEREFALQAKQEKLNEINARALTVDREYENKRRAVMENPEGKLTGALAGELRNLDRQRDQQLADIGIQQAVAQGDVNLVTSRIDSKIKSEFEPMKQRVEGLKSYLSLYNDDLTSSEKIQLESAIKLQESQYESAIKNTSLSQSAKAYQQLLESGNITTKDIPKDVLSQMNLTGYVTPEQKESKLATDSLINSIDNFLAGGATGAVGPATSKALPWLGGLFGVGNFEADKSLVESITNRLTLENLSLLKGAISDKDIGFITKASSALNTNMREGQFKNVLMEILDGVTKGIVDSGSYSIDEKKKALASQFLRKDPSATDEQIAEMVNQYLQQNTQKQSFNSAGNAQASNINIPQSSRLAFVNNNPGNLRFAGQNGASKGQGGFARFNSPQEGLQALQNQIKLDASRGLTLAQFVNKFAPPSENDTKTYIQQVKNMTGATENTPISQIDLLALTKAVAKKESSTNIT